jgi:hypothetical protein
MEKKEDTILSIVQVDGEREPMDWNCCWSRNLRIGMLSVYIVDKRAIPPFGIITSARGWLDIEIK